jgi:hypothetical protein
MDTLGKIMAFIKDFGVIILVVIIGIIFFSMRSETSQMLRSQFEYNRLQQDSIYKLVDTLQNLAKAQHEFVNKFEQRKQVVQEIKIDTGRTIRTFNRAVKETKNVTDPKESYSRLAHFWDYRPS